MLLYDESCQIFISGITFKVPKVLQLFIEENRNSGLMIQHNKFLCALHLSVYAFPRYIKCISLLLHDLSASLCSCMTLLPGHLFQVYSIRDAAANNLKRLAEEFGPEWAMQHIIPQVWPMIFMMNICQLLYKHSDS